MLRRKAPRQCPVFERWLEKLQEDYAADILPVDAPVCEHWGRLMAGRTLPVIDGLIAATALVHGLTMATRNAGDFEKTGVVVVDPWEGI